MFKRTVRIGAPGDWATFSIDSRGSSLAMLLLLLAAMGCDESKESNEGSTDGGTDTSLTTPTDTQSTLDTGSDAPSDTQTNTDEPGVTPTDTTAVSATDTEVIATDTSREEADLDIPPDEALTDIKGRIVTLQENFLTFWLTHGPDQVNGGFHGTIDEDGSAISPADKTLIQQARHLYAFSTWYRQKAARQDVADVADNLYTFFLKYLDATDNLFVNGLSEDGLTVEDDTKDLVGQAHAILALSEYAAAFENTQAGSQALLVFEAVEGAWHDTVNGGYGETTDSDKVLTEHMHLLEAYTALYHATSNDAVKTRLSELVDIIANRFAQPENYFQSELNGDWSVPDGNPRLTWGIEFEVFWLTLEAMSALGQRDDTAVNTLVMVAEHAALNGQDPTGGYSISGKPGEPSNGTAKDWWGQTEAFIGLLKLYLETEDTIHLARLIRTLDFFETYQVDSIYGECFARINPDNTVSNERRKGYEWKSSYHTLRALVYVDLWITNHLELADDGNETDGDASVSDWLDAGLSDGGDSGSLQ